MPSPLPSCGPLREEERHVGADRRRELGEPHRRERLRQELVREQQRGGRVGAAAAEPGGDRDRLLDLDLPARLDARDARQGRRSASVTIVSSANPDTDSRSPAEQRDGVRERDPLQHGHDLVLAVARRSGPTTSARLIFAWRCEPFHRTNRASSRNDGWGERLGTHGRVEPELGERRHRVLAGRHARELEGVGERLASMGECALDDLPEAREVGRERRAPERDERRVDVGRRPKDGARDGMESRSRRGELDQDRDGAVRLRRRERRRSGLRPRAAPSRTRARCVGRPSRLSATIGVATLYGRFATSFVGARLEAARDRAAAHRPSGASRSARRRRRGDAARGDGRARRRERARTARRGRASARRGPGRSRGRHRRGRARPAGR